MKTTSNSGAEDSSPIADFNGHYQFLNNDHPSWVSLDGDLFPSVSTAYQASRTHNHSIRQKLLDVETYEEFKEISLQIPNSSDWHHKKYKVMQRLVRDKFKRNKELGGKLAATHPRGFVNTYKTGGENEQYWGLVEGKGNNSLGKILMTVRDEIRGETDWDRWINDQGVEYNDKNRPQLVLTVIKEDKPIDKLLFLKKNKFFFGINPKNDFKLQHPSISQKHACLYFGQDSTVVIVDLGSSNGTTLTRAGKTFKLEHLKPMCLQKGDIVAFGLSSRKYRVQLDTSKLRGKTGEKGERSRSRSPKERRGGR